jgi:hypothetical protein
LIYLERYGMRIAKDGEYFRCGPIEELKAMGMLPKGCGYE